ncbi:MAG: SUMF1/EgtB/PvdO family nonheme iron enzyme [Bacteroidales bacterium]|jgi:formylglycine-generating enzyme required for sulfatase activity|nr:SUMF1/EgtB/PvdO family nonheme iron enzyme [Bacteroidales bacterium]
MKKVIVFLGVSLAFMSQIFADGKIPANVVALDKASNSYIDIHEVTIGDWNVFLDYIKGIDGENSLAYRGSFPNDDICRQAYKVEDYLTNPNFQNYPIVGITYEQARSYCGWRTDYENRNKKKSNTTIYMYSLPTESDLQNAYDLQTAKTSVKSIAPIDLKVKEIMNVADNVRELTVNKKVVLEAGANGLRFENYSDANANLGFRCKLILK